MISSPISAAINHLLAQEAWARDKLRRHAGKVALLDGGLASVRLKVAADGMLEAGASADAPDVTIRANPADLPLIAQNRERAISYVRIEGDADFANAIAQLAESLRWEAEHDLSRWIGDIAARRVVGSARAAFDNVRAVQRKLAENLAEYLLEENPVLVRPRAVGDFSAEVARLRDDVERLGKRIERLAAAKAGAAPSASGAPPLRQSPDGSAQGRVAASGKGNA